ncbi:hypothetical protein Dimus_032774 [Dionaea muscipula]
MGLSSKQVPSDAAAGGFDISIISRPPSTKRRGNQHQSGSVKCPRCESTNTKFCYYNNYNKSQPRHFCKACKRHWTNGGTLRNVPIGGGGRKNKQQLKTSSHHDTKATNISGKARINDEVGVVSGEKMSDALDFSSSINFNGISLNGESWIFMGSALSLPQNSSNPCLVSRTLHPSNHFTTLIGEATSFEDTGITGLDTSMSSSSLSDQPWTSMPSASSVTTAMPSNNWDWEDIDKFAPADLIIPWDDRAYALDG